MSLYSDHKRLAKFSLKYKYISNYELQYCGKLGRGAPAALVLLRIKVMGMMMMIFFDFLFFDCFDCLDVVDRIDVAD
jgi:hypothetical protein